MELKGKVITFLGDSITQGVGVVNQENRYDERLKKQYKFTALNMGLSGSRIAYNSKPTPDNPQFDLYFCGRAQTICPDSDIVVIFGGTNDYGHGDAPFGSFDDDSPVTFCGAVRYLVRKVREICPGAVIVYMTPAKRYDCNDFGAYQSPDKKMLVEYVDAIIKICKEENVKILDLYRDLGIDATVPEQNKKYLADGLHFNDDGHEVIARKLGEFLVDL